MKCISGSDLSPVSNGGKQINGAGNRKNLVHSTLLLWYLQSLNCLNLTLIICLHGLEGILDIVEVTDDEFVSCLTDLNTEFPKLQECLVKRCH